MVDRILGLNDTPHRIAWGVALGTFVCFTPTIGIQILLYVAVASVVRANRVSGMPILFLSNPVTALPLYYSEWWLGATILHGSAEGDGQRLIDALERLQANDMADTLWSWAYWRDLTFSILDLGVEIWIGATVIGVLASAPVYFVAKRAVVGYRRRKASRQSEAEPPGEAT